MPQDPEPVPDCRLSPAPAKPALPCMECSGRGLASGGEYTGAQAGLYGLNLPHSDGITSAGTGGLYCNLSRRILIHADEAALIVEHEAAGYGLVSWPMRLLCSGSRHSIPRSHERENGRFSMASAQLDTRLMCCHVLMRCTKRKWPTGGHYLICALGNEWNWRRNGHQLTGVFRIWRTYRVGRIPPCMLTRS